MRIPGRYLLFVYFWSVFLNLQAAEQDLPPSAVCASETSNEKCQVPAEARREARPPDVVDLPPAEAPACALWYYDNGWVLAGRSYAAQESLDFWRDVMIPFRQHSRRAFPKWNRHHYLIPRPKSANAPKDKESSRPELLFVPAWNVPFECHARFANLQRQPSDIWYNMTGFMSQRNDVEALLLPLNDPLTTARVVAKGDPLFLPCIDEELAAVETYEDFPDLAGEEPDADDSAECLEGLRVQASTLPGAGWGSFATRSFAAGDTVASGPVLHMHRSEFRDPLTGQDELLLNYCYGHEQSSLLLLPLFYGVNTINHQATEANVRVQWDTSAAELQKIFSKPTEQAFSESEAFQLLIKFVALRDIAPGEEIFLDYGPAWTAAWLAYSSSSAAAADLKKKPFRQEIGLPLGMYPETWLAREVLDPDYPVLDTSEVALGQVEPVRLTTGQALSEGLHRVRLPPGFADRMEHWANSTGITDIMRAYIVGPMTLEPDGQERQRINGTTWWVKRFWNEWKANMHYISPDDDDSFSWFMSALSDAGFDQVLASIGQHFGLKTLTAYYPSYIAVSHATYSSMHSDAYEPGQFNMIFPVIQVENADPELTLATDKKDLHVPYKYERDHAALLGKDGQHGTAPCDYRGTGHLRMVLSVYMADFSREDLLDAIVEEWETGDPPFPRREGRKEYLRSRVHWSAQDPSYSLKTPFGHKEKSSIAESS